MTWKYDQESGDIYLNDKFVSSGYSGAGDGKNKPEMQDVPNVGPIPQGNYTIGEPSNFGNFVQSTVHPLFLLATHWR
jgi:hypothetical protein